MSDTSTTDSTDTESAAALHQIADRIADVALLTSVVVLVAAQPVAAQTASEQICNNDSLSQLFSGAFSLLTAFGVISGLAAYKYQYLVGIVSMNPQQQERLKQRKQQIKTSAIGLIAIDAVYLVAAPMMGLPQFGCLFS